MIPWLKKIKERALLGRLCIWGHVEEWKEGGLREVAVDADGAVKCVCAARDRIVSGPKISTAFSTSSLPRNDPLDATIISIVQKSGEPDNEGVERGKPLGHLRV